MCMCACAMLGADPVTNEQRQSTADVAPGRTSTTEWPALLSAVIHFITVVVMCHILTSYVCNILILW